MHVTSDFDTVDKGAPSKPIATLRGPLGKLFSTIHRLFEIAVVILFASMVFAALWQVFNRFFLGSTLSWSEEFQRYSHIWLVFFAIPIGYRRSAHIGVDILQNALGARGALVLSWIIDFAWLTLGIAIIAGTTTLMGVAWRQTSPGMGVTMDKVYLGLLIGGAYLVFTAVDRLLQKVLGVSAA